LPPYNKISKNDIIVIKKSGSSILGLIFIKEILEFELTNNDAVLKLKEKYNDEILADDVFWKSKENSHYATLIKIDKIIKLQPFKIDKKGMQSWILLNK